MTALRLAAHRRLVAAPRRGRVLLQLAFVADRDADELECRWAWPPVDWRDLPEETRAEVRRLRALGDALYAEARRLGVTGGTDEAMRDVLAEVRPMLDAGAARETLVLRVADALEAGAILTAGDVELAACRAHRGRAPAGA